MIGNFTLSLRVVVVLLGAVLLIYPKTYAQEDMVRFVVIGDFGESGEDQTLVATLIKSWSVDFIITTGDNSYGDDTIDENIGEMYGSYIGGYNGEFGSGPQVNRFFPSLGNHDYTDGGGVEAYLNFFTLPGDGIGSSNTSGNERYYDFIQGPVHFFAVNSNEDEPDGYREDSAQAEWLQTQMEASTVPWKFVYFHHAPYSSGEKHGDDRDLQWPFDEWGADVVFSGHEHLYERLMVDENEDGAPIPYIIVGFSGGPSIYEFSEETIAPDSRVRYNAAPGATLVEVSSDTATFETWSIADGGTLVDSYTLRHEGSCATAYNDFGWGNGQQEQNITKITASGGHNLPSRGNLVDFATGQPLSVELSVRGGDYGGPDSDDIGRGDAELAGDAYDIFFDRLNPEGTLTYNTDDRYLLLEFSGLDPQKAYDVVFYANRSGSDSYDWGRASLVTILGVESFINASTHGTDDQGAPLFSGPLDASTRHAGNNEDGRVVRYNNIKPGIGGHFALIVYWDGEIELDADGNQEFTGKYANALMLQECPK